MMRFRFSFMVILLVAAGVGGGCAAGSNAVCGNQICESQDGETAASCPKDCGGAFCGNGLCEAGENPQGCAQDCFCGNGTCDLGEDATSCAQDCGAATCGDGVCGATESVSTCAGDCYCGNQTCDTGESAASCPGDCPASCGDGTCDVGETNANCPEDCGSAAHCGDGTCDVGETNANCPQDCPAATENCSNGIDDDGDGQVDCLDSDCTGDPACQTANGVLSCTGINACYQCCPSGDTTCYDNCDAQGSTTGASQMDAYLTCVNANCYTECSGTDSAACNACIDQHCPSERDACDWDPSGSGGCMDLDTCLATCPQSLQDGAGTATTCPDVGTLGANAGLGCIQTCMGGTSPSGYSQYMAVIDCMWNQCQTECYGTGTQTDCSNCQTANCSTELGSCS